jgi:protocatechuate 4,5-dioxygenase alpha chain
MALNKDYEDIPGTFVFDADRGREGYQLNQFCISLRLKKNRATFTADEATYLSSYSMTAEQREAVLDRDWNRLLELGGNIYYTSKLAANDGINFQQLAGLMTGMGNEAYREMMVAGGRSPDGNRYQHEWDKKDKN